MDSRVFVPSAEETNQDISAMHDSVTVINETILLPYSQEAYLTISRNVEHLKLMLSKEHISNHESDKTVFTQAISSGEAFLSEHAE